MLYEVITYVRGKCNQSSRLAIIKAEGPFAKVCTQPQLEDGQIFQDRGCDRTKAPGTINAAQSILQVVKLGRLDRQEVFYAGG